MNIISFSLMPYRPLDIHEASKHRAAWVVLPNRLYDPVKGAEEYQSHIDSLVYAEDLGFDGIAVNEHHQTAYGMMPAPNLIASALIARTKRVKIAILGRALPIVSNPIYIAEELAMLDNLSKGRIIAGFVRGIGAEYHSSGVNPFHSHARFHEAHDLIVKAWTETGPFAFDGDFFDTQYVNLWPRPYQTPHPPIWIPSMGSGETIEWAADPKRKYPFLVTFSASELVVRYLNNYREQTRKYGYEASGEQLGWACPIYVAESDERARKEASAHIATLFNNFIRMPWEMLLPPGYSSMSSVRNHLKLRTALGSRPAITGEELIKSGTALIGSPKTVLSRINEMRDKTGVDILLGMFQFGTLSDALTRRNLDLFASEVMPGLRK